MKTHMVRESREFSKQALKTGKEKRGRTEKLEAKQLVQPVQPACAACAASAAAEPTTGKPQDLRKTAGLAQ